MTNDHEFEAAPVPLIQAALWYAENGLPVFPLRPGTKLPMGKCQVCKDTECRGPDICFHKLCHGFKDATTDADQIRTWWEATPEANIGLATGHVVDVVDIDGAIGQKSRVELWESTFGRIDADAVAKVLTPRAGGMHIYVRPTGDGNGAGICPGIDYRGIGGYVVAPPSVTDVGRYRFLGDATPLTELGSSAA